MRLTNIDSEHVGNQVETPLDILSIATGMSIETIKKAYRVFKRNRGQLNQKKFEMFYDMFEPQEFKYSTTSQVARLIFKVFDQNHDGFVTFSDFIMGMTMLANGTIKQKLEFAFGYYDVNDDGWINDGDLIDGLTVMFGFVGFTDIDDMIEQFVDENICRFDPFRLGRIYKDWFIKVLIEDEHLRENLVLF